MGCDDNVTLSSMYVNQGVIVVLRDCCFLFVHFKPPSAMFVFLLYCRIEPHDLYLYMRTEQQAMMGSR